MRNKYQCIKENTYSTNKNINNYGKGVFSLRRFAFPMLTLQPDKQFNYFYNHFKPFRKYFSLPFSKGKAA